MYDDMRKLVDLLEADNKESYDKIWRILSEDTSHLDDAFIVFVLLACIKSRIHHRHGDFIVLAESIPCDLLVESLYDIVVNPPNYYPGDSDSIRRRIIHLFAKIGTKVAEDKIIKLADSKNLVVSVTAKERLLDSFNIVEYHVPMVNWEEYNEDEAEPPGKFHGDD